jgi:hypothetical protein
MRVSSLFLAGLLTMAAYVCSPAFAASEQPDISKMRKAFCQKEAAAKHFGVHFIKRQRYINSCLAATRKR